MIKRLFLIRHAKAELGSDTLQDIDRPLSLRGYEAAHFMSRHMKGNHHPHAMISSPAIRAISTALIFAREFEFPENLLQLNGSFYESTVENLVTQIAGFDDACEHIFMFGHNPSITQLANILTESRIDHVPTCGIVGIDIGASTWKALDKAKLHFFDYPKNHPELY